MSDFLEEAGLGHTEGRSSFQSFKLENYNKPPKALYHSRSRAPIRTERAVSKEGSQDFWKQLDLTSTTKSPNARSLVNQLHKNTHHNKAKDTTIPRGAPPAQVSQNETHQSIGTSLTGQTNFTAKMKEQKTELQKLIKDMAEKHSRDMKANSEKIKSLETTIEAIKDTQDTLSKGFAAMTEQSASINKQHTDMFENLDEKIDRFENAYSNIEEFMKTILTKMDTDPTLLNSPKRKKPLSTLSEAYNQDMSAGDDNSSDEDMNPQLHTQEDAGVGGSGC